MADTIPFFKMDAELRPIRAEIDAAIARVLDSGVLVGGEEVAAFERELAVAVGTRRAVGVSSGSDALHVLGMALGIGAGSEIVTTPLTFIATAGSFARLGVRIIFSDVDDATLCLDPIAALSACTTRTRAIVPVSLFGHPAALPVGAPCAVIEDCAQAIGAVPVRGLAAALSFFPTKNLGALGDAGAVLTDDEALADRVALLRTHGAKPKYHHAELGGNFRLDALQAAVLRVKLRRLTNVSAARRAAAEHYRSLFSAAQLPSEVRLPAAAPTHVYHQFAIRAPRRDALRSYLRDRGIETHIYYPEPLHLQPCFAELGYAKGIFPNAERACSELLALPIQSVVPNERERIVEQLAAFYGNAR